MKIDVTQVLRDLEGNSILLDSTKEATLKDVIKWALLKEEESDKEGLKKYENYELAKLVQKVDCPDLTVEELSKIKEKIQKNFSTIVVGAAFDLIENK